ncbi:MAG: 2-dehydro-3-deoxygalactonokinase [Burkholderiales bacterium]
MIAVDWGTSSFRAYRLSVDGRILDKRTAAFGILHVADRKFGETLTAQIGEWLEMGEGPVLMSGMIGSRQGWIEAPYCECPAGFPEIASKLKEVAWERRRIWIAPGICGRDSSGVRDVMRGEEMQILGAMDSLPGRSGLVCLPGTHSKWVEVRDGKIENFATHMTGEVFAVLKEHSILGRMMTDATDTESFSAGLSRAKESGGLLHHLFGVRARGLFGEISDGQSASYLSGILIGHEVKAALESKTDTHIYILGTPHLSALYASACDAFGVESTELDSESVVRGLYLLSQHLN